MFGNFSVKQNKYKNSKCFFGDIKFDSIKERGRYIILLDQQNKGEIKDLELQPKFVLQDKFVLNGKTYREVVYIADFRYFRCSDNKTIIEDVKGFKTSVYKLKKKLFLHSIKNDVNYIFIET